MNTLTAIQCLQLVGVFVMASVLLHVLRFLGGVVSDGLEYRELEREAYEEYLEREEATEKWRRGEYE